MYPGWFKDALSETILAFQRINEALLVYLHELEQIDIEAFKRETQEYNKAVRIFSTATTDKELNVLLLDTFEQWELKSRGRGILTGICRIRMLRWYLNNVFM